MGTVLGNFILKSAGGIPRNGLVAEWLFNNNYLDTSGNGFNGVNGGTTFVNDRKGSPNSAIQALVASSQFVNIDDALAGLATNTKGTLSVWAKPVSTTPVTTSVLLAFGDTDANTFIRFAQLSTGKLNMFTRIAGVTQFNLITDNVVFTGGAWRHYLITQNATIAKLYVDGTFVDQTITGITDQGFWFNGAPLIDNGRISAFNFNSGGNVQFFNGSLDDIRLYDRDLTQEEITILANE